MTLTQIKYALAVSKHGSFARAAEKSHIAQPTLSLQIKKLEQELGVELFDRSKNPIESTRAGKEFIEQAGSVIHEANKLEGIFRSDQEELTGILKIAIIPTVGTYLLPLIISPLREKYPKIDFEFLELPTRQIVNELNNEEIDIGIAATPLETGLEEIQLYYEPFVLYSSEDHKVDQQEYSEEMLNQFPLLILTNENCFRGQVLKLCPRSGTSRIECSSLETIIRLVDANVGVTLIPQLYADFSTHLKKSQLVELAKPVPSREISLLTRASFYKKEHLRAVKEAIPPEMQTVKDKRILGIDDI